MDAVPEPTRHAATRGWTAFAVLVIALAVTAFCVWREHELIRRSQTIRWQEGFAQLQPILQSLLNQRFETLHDQVRTALRRDDFSENGWRNFVNTSEWEQRFPGMLEIGYADFTESNCIVRFVSSKATPAAHPMRFDLDTEPTIREAIEKSADAGYGIPSRTIPLRSGTNTAQTIVGLLTIPRHDQRPAGGAANRANLRGVLFFVLDQQEYFRFCQPNLKSLPFAVRLLAPDEAPPAKTATQRSFTNGGVSGEWRFVGTMKASSSAATNLPQWIVLIGGTALSFLLYFLFASQAKLRMEAETANKKTLDYHAQIVAFNRDLEQKIFERTAQLNEALAEEKELNRLKSNFISMVTHEIRTPLSLILGSSEILSRYLERLSPEKRSQHLQTIESAVQRMTALMEDVLLFSKAEAGRMEFNPVELDLKTFCAQMVDELQSATNRRCSIELSVADPGQLARADEGLLRHIFFNLITNAVKYSPAGTTVKFSVTREAGDAIFVTQDSGMGIPEEDRRRLFTPFYRSKKVATIQGTGLGLVIVKHCVERHGGMIEIESTENSGTTVRVRLPLFSPAHTEFIKRILATEEK